MTERASYGAGLAALRPGGVAITEEALSHLLIDTDTRLLDIGCGRGESLAWVQQRFGCHCAGVDLAADYAAQAAAACPAADIRQGDAGKLPFAAASFTATQRSSAEVLSSSSEGYEGAILIFLSSGSFL